MKDIIINSTLALVAVASLIAIVQAHHAPPGAGPAHAYCSINQDPSRLNNCIQQQRRQREMEQRLQQLEREQRQLHQHRTLYGY